MKRMTCVLVVLGIACGSSAAMAEEKAAPAAKASQKPIVVHLDPIKGRVDVPHAAVDIAQATLKRPLTELRQPFVSRIERVVERAPF